MHEGQQPTEIVIIGGGAIGINVAYHLNRHQETDVTVLEAGQIGSGATSLGLGGIRRQFSSRLLTRVMQSSIATFQEYERTGTEFQSRQNGYVFLASTTAETTGLRSDATMHRSLGIEIDLLDSTAIENLVPYLVTTDLRCGAHDPGAIVTDQYTVTQWLAEEFTSQGGTVCERTPVTDIVVDDGVTAVETPTGQIDCDVVVNAAGIKAPSVVSESGVGLPIEPERIQVVTVDGCHPVTADNPFVVDVHERRYFRPMDDGKLAIGGQHRSNATTVDTDDAGTHPDRTFIEDAMDFLEKRTTGLDGPAVTGGWIGYKGVTPDGLPVVGEHDAISGLYTAAGFDGYGFMIAPAVGTHLSHYILTGAWPTVDLKPFSPDRFASRSVSDSAGSFMNVSEDTEQE